MARDAGGEGRHCGGEGLVQKMRIFFLLQDIPASRGYPEKTENGLLSTEKKTKSHENALL